MPAVGGFDPILLASKHCSGGPIPSNFSNSSQQALALSLIQLSVAPEKSMEIPAPPESTSDAGRRPKEADRSAQLHNCQHRISEELGRLHGTHGGAAQRTCGRDPWRRFGKKKSQTWCKLATLEKLGQMMPEWSWMYMFCNYIHVFVIASWLHVPLNLPIEDTDVTQESAFCLQPACSHASSNECVNEYLSQVIKHPEISRVPQATA